MLLVAFDLEGPLSPQDNAYELMALIPDGRRLFERLSRYDDLLALSGRPDYEPGDTLKLILPFLLAHGINETHIRQVSEKALLVDGAAECIRAIWSKGWQPCIISTSYEPHALNIAERVGVPPDLVVATKVDFETLEGAMTDDSYSLILSWQKRILECPSDDDEQLKALLDEFFWQHLVKFPIGIALELLVMGGRRKTEALRVFLSKFGLPFNHCVVIGDSITDYHMLKTVRDEGGLTIVFNGNEYALPYGVIGIASLDLKSILPLLEIFAESGLEGCKDWVCQQKPQNDWDAHYQVLSEETWQNALPVHRKFRQAVRGQAAKLG
ncbi:MAG: haloacid dehalogenase-like hydrolase [Armatimonadetes bacterium]|nr:haloacid dehalogenase-like hydrolase [Armatimonadota bacterium]